MDNPTFLRKLSKPQYPALRLVCFPFAGGGASAYRPFAPLLANCVELAAVQLPGRADRIGETPLARLEQAADGIAAEIVRLAPQPTALFGHSMGAFLAFECALRLERAGLALRGLIVSGQTAPGYPDQTSRCRGDASEAELAEDLQRLGGTPRALLADPEMRRIIMRTIRADYTMLDHYAPQAGGAVGCALVACGAHQDPSVTPDGLAAWAGHTRARYAEYWCEGGHFAPFAAAPEFCRNLNHWIVNEF